MDDTPNSANIPMLIVRKQAARATFVAVWLIGDNVKDVTIDSRPEREGKLVYEIRVGPHVRQHLLPKL